MKVRSGYISAILALAGVAVLAWVAVTLLWGEPLSALGTARAQAALNRELDAAKPRRVRRPRQGSALGRIIIPRLGVRMVFVQGTSHHDLARGPGHYRITRMPGRGGTVAIAGHRTTHLRPFRHLDDLRPGNNVYLQMPYGTYRYVVYARRIVDDKDWSILRPRRFEKLVLSACHPLYSASQRIVVFGRLVASERA
jgi:sortase A